MRIAFATRGPRQTQGEPLIRGAIGSRDSLQYRSGPSKKVRIEVIFSYGQRVTIERAIFECTTCYSSANNQSLNYETLSPACVVTGVASIGGYSSAHLPTSMNSTALCDWRTFNTSSHVRQIGSS